MFANLWNVHDRIAYLKIADQYQRNNLTKEAQAAVEVRNTERASPNLCPVLDTTQDIQPDLSH